MTSQQLLMNHLGVALASDSTVTMGGMSSDSGRTYSTVNKIFSLAGRQPIAFMVSNAANYIPAGISWERVIGLYREYRGEEELPRVIDYLSDFKKFIGTHEHLAVPTVNDIAIQTDLINYFTKVVDPADHKERLKGVRLGYAAEQVWKETDLTNYFDLAINQRIHDLVVQVREKAHGIETGERSAEWLNHVYKTKKRHEINASLAAEKFCQRHDCVSLQDEMNEIFLFHLAWAETDFEWRAASTMVIAGFGRDEMKPTMCSFEVACDVGAGPFGETTRCYIRNKQELSDDGSWIQEDSPDENLWSTIGFSRGFARMENMETILSGINPQTLRYLSDTVPALAAFNAKEKLLEILSEVEGFGKVTMEKIQSEVDKKYSEFEKSISEVMVRELWDEVNFRKRKFDTVTAYVPVEELARFVEILVALEAQVSHYLDDIRTVGGPIDVASITKEDGFLWVKSKQIFDSSLNPRQGEVDRSNANLI